MLTRRLLLRTAIGAGALRIAGLPDPTIYVGSYSDWSRSGLPIATGPEPGRAPFSG